MLRRICFYPVIGFDSGFTGLLDYIDYLALSVGLGVLNQDFQDFEDFLVLGVVWDGESGFSGFRGFFSVRRCYRFCVLQLMNHFLSTIFFISYPFNLEDNWVLSCSLVLNQDFQDFEDFLVLDVVIDFACCSL